ncbi:3188_t:CDS:2, partial [Racocetra fulgida]
LLCDKFIAYLFPSVDEDYKDYEQSKEPPCYPTGTTTSCNDKLAILSDSSWVNFVYYDPNTSFTDGTSLTMPVGFDFRVSANSSSANDLSPAFITYPAIRLVDPNLFNKDNSRATDKLNDILSEEINTYVLSPYQ